MDATARTRDPETGYLGQNTLGEDFGPEIRCCRCGGRAMWKPPRQPESPLCLQCSDELFNSDIWDKCKTPKYDRINNKKWKATFAEFLTAKPKQIDIQDHNRRIEYRGKFIHAMFPQYFSKSN